MTTPTEAYKILFVGEYAGFIGGIERYMHQTAQLLRENGFAVDCLFNQKARDYELFAANFDQVFTSNQLNNRIQDYQLIVIHKLRDQKLIDSLLNSGQRIALFVHDHEYYCPRRAYYWPITRHNCHLAYQRWRCGCCAMVQRHPDIVGNFSSFGNLWRSLKKFPEFLVISDFMRNNLIHNGIERAKINKITPAIPLGELSEPESPPRLIFTGQLIKGKGVDQLLDAVMLMKQQAIIDIVGHGSEYDKLKNHPAVHSGKARLQGWSTTPESFLQGATAMVLPWRWQEPFGLVGVEALASGVPLVGFDIGGVREYLIPEENGILVAPGDIPGLAAGMDKIVSDPVLSQKYGRAGRTMTAQRFTHEAALGSWRKIAGVK